MKNDDQKYPPASTESRSPYSFPSFISQDFINEIKQIGSKGIESNINQIPSAANEHTAVVTSVISTQQGQFSGIGAANPEMLEGSTSPQALLDRAYQQSVYRSVGAASICPPIGNRTIDVTPVPKSSQQNGNDQKNYIHSDKKLMTPKQQRSLEGIAKSHGTTLSEVAQEVIGKTVEQLSSKDAHKLFQKFNNHSAF